MNLDDATNTLRILAAIAGQPAPGAVFVTLTPFKGFGERSHKKGYMIAEAEGWRERPASTDRYSKSFTPAREGRNAEHAVDELLKSASDLAARALAKASMDADNARLAAAKAAADAAAAQSVYAERLALSRTLSAAK